MEKEPKIGKSLEKDIAIPEFQTKGENRLTVEPSEDLGTIERWEDKLDPRNISIRDLFGTMLDHPEGLSSDIIAICNKGFHEEKLNKQERSRLDKAKDRWFKDRFGVTFAGRKHFVARGSLKKRS